ncbi:hypothetical protein [Breoghania sp.]
MRAGPHQQWCGPAFSWGVDGEAMLAEGNQTMRAEHKAKDTLTRT